MKNLNIAVIGCTIITEKLINVLIKNKFNIYLIITKKNDKLNSDFVDLKKKIRGIKIIEDRKLEKKSTQVLFKKFKINLIFCAGWSHIIKNKILNIKNINFVGHHPTYLPENKGKHPIIWSRFIGLSNFGSTFFLMDKKIDSGKILNRKKIKINNNDNSKKMFNKLFNTISSQIPHICKNINKLTNLNENKNKKGNYWRKRYFIDGKIDFRMSAISIQRLIQALDKPYPGAHIEFKGKNFKVFKSQVYKFSNKNILPGTILKKKKFSLVVKCYENVIEVFNKDLNSRSK